MNFKAYDILSSLIPGFLMLLVILSALNKNFENNQAIAYTAIAFLLGYLMNTLSSWLEDFYYWTWGGKPSNQLLKGKGIWKVKFYHTSKVKADLIAEANNNNAREDELFSIAMRYANGQNPRVDDFNGMYAFSRVLLTTTLIGTLVLLVQNYNEWQAYVTLLPILFVVWMRCKQRGYYYAREVLNVYLKLRNP
jgi:hypothetical protein